jgi:pimeloyl-ACP methyl ester carboxylesterase
MEAPVIAQRPFSGTVLSLLLWLCSPIAAQPAAPTPTQAMESRLVDIGGFRLRLQAAGTGSPTVVLDAGGGDRLETWAAIIPEIARFTRVVAYDRAGLGSSDLGPEPRSFTRSATELHTLLRRAGIAPPYILVGHSFGNGVIRGFAHLFRDEVAGLVFVDPVNQTIFKTASAGELEEEKARQAEAMKSASPGVRAEFGILDADIDKGFPELTSFGRPPDVPMMLLVAGRQGPRWVKAVLSEFGAWIAEAAEGGLVLSPESGHYIHKDDPALVVSSIRRVVFPSVLNTMRKSIAEVGVTAAIARYREMRQRYPAEYLRETILNVLGYERLRAGRAEDAVALFKLNVEMYPGGYNGYDSLGDGYLALGNREAAAASYKKALELNPDSRNTAQKLKKLEQP